MESLLRISEAASLGIHAMAYLASTDKEVPQSVALLAGVLSVSEAHLSKVLQRLAKHGLVTSRRGPRGGFVLAREPETIRLLEVYEAIDGPLTSGTCLLGRAVCAPGACIMGDVLESVHDHVRRYFSTTLLSDMIAKNPFRHIPFLVDGAPHGAV